jgi:hypothetical protein
VAHACHPSYMRGIIMVQTSLGKIKILLKISKVKRGSRLLELEQNLPNQHEALSSNLSTTKKTTKNSRII